MKKFIVSKVKNKKAKVILYEVRNGKVVIKTK